MKCPGDGLAPFYWDNVVGQQLLVDVEEEHSLSLDNFKPLHD
jgi:hypothetical protein